MAVFVGELDGCLTEAISELKDIGYIDFAKPTDHTTPQLHLSHPENGCSSAWRGADAEGWQIQGGVGKKVGSM